MMAGRVTVGHPVDVGSGAVYTLSTDFRIPGVLPVLWRRHYSTVATSDTWLGPRWTVPYFMTLVRESGRYVLSGAHGEQVYFASPDGPLRAGTKLVNFAANMELERDRDQYRVLHWHTNGKVARFCFAARRETVMPLAAVEDLSGHRVRVDYDPAGRPARLVQELEQRTLEITYDRRNLVGAVSFVGGAGPKLLVRYEYDSGRRLVAAYDAMGHRKGYEYDPEGRLTAETNPLGSRFVFEYDRLGRCTRTAGSDGFLERKLRYTAAPPMTRVTDSRGGVTEYYLNAAGQVVQTVAPTGAVTTNTFDEHGRLVGVIHPDLGKESSAYDEQGNRTAEVDPTGAVTKTEYDENHVPTRVVDRNGNAWGLANQNAGSLLGVEGLPPLVWVYHRDARGLVTQADSWGGRLIRVRRDPRFRWQEIHDQFGLVTRTEYDEMGFPTEVRDAGGLVSQTRYDDLHRPIEVTRGSSEVTRYRWNAAGRVTERIGPGGQHDTWVYDDYGQLRVQLNALGDSVGFEYDTEGKWIAIVNRVGERLEYRRDAAGRVAEEKHFDGRTQRYEYDPAGRPVKIYLSDGRTVAQRFDPAGRLVLREASDGLVEEFAYDKEGREIEAWNNYARVKRERDRFGRVVAEVQNGRRIEYRYDPDGRPIGRTLPFAAAGSRLVREFDTRGRLRALKDERGTCQEFRWDEIDRLIERRCPGGVSETFVYDRERRLGEQRIDAAGGAVVRTHGYDPSGNLTTLQDGRGAKADFGYDRLNRLTEVRSNGLRVESYEYDGNNGILGTHRGSRGLAAGGRTVRDGLRELSYGADGAVCAIRMAGSALGLKHDVNGRLVEVIGPDGTSTRYEYDPFARRTAKVIGGVRTEFLWDDRELAAEVRDGEVRSIYASAELRPIAQWESGRRLTPILDHRGAAREVYDESGELRWRCALDAYGNLLTETGDTPNPFRLRGQYHDAETGLYYNYFRHYDPRLGDYTAPDPIGVEGGYHCYAYPRNPLTRDDPYGLECGEPEKHPPGLDDLPDDVLYRIAARDKKGRPFGSPGHPDPPTPEQFGARIELIPAGELAKTIVDTKHATIPEQRAKSQQLSNAELVQFRPSDPLSATPVPGGLSQTGGHHRAEEIARRVDSGQMPPDTPVPVLVHN